ncbi:MAG: sulfatase [Verrucomicrobia bacterium]|nr:sulfatase [Verrucomicrobiota bacterium]
MKNIIPFFAICIAASLPVIATAAQPPNVLFIAVDDLRPELGCYGATHMVTPNIDTLASQGRLFGHHFVGVPTCGASRYALMTGLRPTASTDHNGAFVDHMPTSEPIDPESWVDLLRRNGWNTASIGKVTHEPDGYRWNDSGTYDIGRYEATYPEMRFSWNEIIWDHAEWGAQRYPLFAYAGGTGRVRNVTPAYEIGVDAQGASLEDDACPDGQIAQAVIDKLREFSDDGQRFCLNVGFMKPHLPFNAPKKYYDLYDPATLPEPSPVNKPSGANSSTTVQAGEPGAYTGIGDRDVLRRAYFANVSYIDAQVGKVLAELDALGLADNTIVVLWGDHGWCLDDYTLLGKHVVLERGVHSPLIIRPPAGVCSEAFDGIHADGVVETIDLYPTIAELCGISLPSSPGGSSLVPLLRNPFAPGKDSAYSRYGSVQSVRTADWRLIKASTAASDLYDLASFPYELTDISGSNPTVVGDLESKLTVQGTRPGIIYSDWAEGHPDLADPLGDADSDGALNFLEYSLGTDALDPESFPTGAMAIEDLSGLGFGTREYVYSIMVATPPDDVLLDVLSTTNLLSSWSSTLLEFLDADDLGTTDTMSLRFRLISSSDPSHFFKIKAEGR